LRDFKTQGAEEFLSDMSSDAIDTAVTNFLATYSADDEQSIWFDKLKISAEKSGFAIDNKQYKANQDSFHGNVADFARILRVKLTGKTEPPICGR